MRHKIPRQHAMNVFRFALLGFAFQMFCFVMNEVIDEVCTDEMKHEDPKQHLDDDKVFSSLKELYVLLQRT